MKINFPVSHIYHLTRCTRSSIKLGWLYVYYTLPLSYLGLGLISCQIFCKKVFSTNSENLVGYNIFIEAHYHKPNFRSSKRSISTYWKINREPGWLYFFLAQYIIQRCWSTEIYSQISKCGRKLFGWIFFLCSIQHHKSIFRCSTIKIDFKSYYHNQSLM